MARPANDGLPQPRSKEGLMIRFFLAALEVFPWLLRPLTDLLPGSGDEDNRGSMDPNG